MDAAMRTVEGGAAAVKLEAQERAAAQREAHDRVGCREMGGAGEPDDVVGGERNDLVMTAPPTHVALIREWGVSEHRITELC